MIHEAVIFDLFGTLVDGSSGVEVHRLLNEMAEVLAVPRDEFARLWIHDTRHLRSTGRLPTIEAALLHMARELGVAVTSEQVRAATAMRTAFTRQALTPRADTIATLVRLKEAGRKRGLVSDCSPDVPRLWAETDMAHHIDAPVFSCIAGTEKPDPRIYLMACERLAVAPERCLYVGDGDSHELTGAAGVGMSAVLIRTPDDHGFRQRQDTWTEPRIGALSEVLDLLTTRPGGD